MSFYVLSVILIILAILWVRRVVRGLDRLRRQARGAWTQLDTQLNSRQESAGKLFEYLGPQPAEHAARIQAINPQADPPERFQAEAELSAAITTVLAAGAAPDNRELAALHDIIARQNKSIEIAAEFYNLQALYYNARIMTMSFNLVARLAGYRPVALYRSV